MKKRIVSLMLATIMALGCLAGCGGDTQTQTSKESETTSVQESTVQESSEPVKEELKDATVQIMLMGPGKQKDAEKVWAAFNEKLQEYVPNTTVEFTIVPAAEYKDRFNQMLAAGEGIDLAWAGYCSPSQDSLVLDGSLMPLNDLLDEYGQDIKAALGEKILDISTYSDGNIYYTISWQSTFCAKRGWYIPKRLADLAGDTWVEDTRKIVADYHASSADGYDIDKMEAVYDQFDIYLNALKENGVLYSGIGTTAMVHNAQQFNNDGQGPLLNWCGIERGDNTFTVKDLVASDVYRAFARLQAEYYQKGYIRSDIASIDTTSLVFMQKDATGELTPNATILRMHNMFSDNEIAKYTKENGEEIIGIELEDEGYLGRGVETSMVIPYCADEAERGMMVLNAIYAYADLYNLLIYGIEGEHYTANADGTITVADKYNTADSNYGLNNWYIGTCLNGYTNQNQVVGYYEELAKAEETAIVSPFLQFVFDQSSVSDIASALSAIDKEYKTIIERGYADDWEATLDKWIAERKAAGVDKYIAEYQKQLDEFRKENNITAWEY